LKDLKASNPVKVAEYAVANRRIIEEPAFKWWAPHVLLHRRNQIISKVKPQYWKMTHKFGVYLPKTVEEALEIDKATNMDLWRKAVNKEMAKVKIAGKTHDGFTPQQAREGEVPDLFGFEEIGCHIVFDVKMDFTRKVCFVAGGHTITAPSSMTCSSVISRDSIQLAFLIASLNDLNIMSCDLENAPRREKIWFEGGIKCGKDHSQVCIMVLSLYGLKSAGAAFHSSLEQILQDIGYKSTKADLDVLLHKATKENKFEYYEMLLVYVNNMLTMSHHAKEAIH
jgi:hypothetical protein